MFTLSKQNSATCLSVCVYKYLNLSGHLMDFQWNVVWIYNQWGQKNCRWHWPTVTKGFHKTQTEIWQFLDTLRVFIHSVVCLTTGPTSPLKRFLHIVRSRASSFKWDYPLLSLKSYSSFLSLLPRLPVTSIPLFIFPSINRCRRQFLRKMWPIQLAFRFLISYRIFLCSLTVSNTSSFLTWSVQLIFSILLQHHISKLSRYFWSAARSVQVSAPYKAMFQM